MRLLERARPHVHVLEVEVLALERERPGPRPRLDDEIVRLLVALEAPDRIGAGREIFRADAAHEAGDQPAAGDAVDHRVLFGERQRIVAQAEGVAEDRDLGVFTRRDSAEAVTTGEGMMP